MDVGDRLVQSVIRPVTREVTMPVEGKSDFSWSSYWATRTPSDLVLTALSPTSIKLDWTNAGTADYDGHSIERSGDGITYAEIDTVLVGTNTFTDIGLTHGTPYYYRVRAYKNTNYSDYCTPVLGETIYLPSDIAGLYTWYDISQITGKNDGDLVTSVTDFSGNGIHLNSSGSSTYKTNILNGQPCLRYDGVAQYNRNALITAPANMTIFGVITDRGGSGDVVVDIYPAPDIYINGTEISMSCTGTVTTSGANIVTGTPFIYSAVLNGGSSCIWKDGGYAASPALLQDSGGNKYYSAARYGGSVFWGGDKFHEIVYSVALSATNRRRVEEYLAWKYGIALVPI